MRINYHTLLLAVILGMTACSTETVTPNADDELAIEGTLEEVLWVIENAELPTAEMRNDYERMEFRVSSDLNYDWLWVGKNGNDDYHFKGDTYYEKSAATHSSGSAIYNIAVNVQTINDLPLPGGFYGIYTYEDENHMVLNVEPDVTNWGKHPTADEGIGSGQSGNGSVYKFTKEN